MEALGAWPTPVSTWVFVAVLTLGAWTDLRTRRIPNVLTVGGLAAALGLRAWVGPEVLFGGLEGAGLALLVCLPLFALGGMGGGDAKLLIAMGAFLGSERLVGALLLIALVGGLLAVMQAARRGLVLSIIRGCFSLLRYWVTFGAGGQRPGLGAGAANAVTMPYGLAIALGGIVWWFYGGALK